MLSVSSQISALLQTTGAKTLYLSPRKIQGCASCEQLMLAVPCLVEDQRRRRRVPGGQGPVRELLHQLQHARVWPLHLCQNRQRSAPPASSCTSCSARASGCSTCAKLSSVRIIRMLLYQLQHARVRSLHCLCQNRQCSAACPCNSCTMHASSRSTCVHARYQQPAPQLDEHKAMHIQANLSSGQCEYVLASCCHHLAVGVHDEQQELAVRSGAPRRADPPGMAVAPVVPGGFHNTPKTPHQHTWRPHPADLATLQALRHAALRMG